MSCMLRPLTWFTVLGLVGVLLGCNKGSPTSSPAPAGGGPVAQNGGPPQAVLDVDAEPHSAGKKAMAASGCFRCHAVNGARAAMAGGGGPMGRGGPPGPGGPGPGGPGGPGPRGPGGPDLGHEGQDPTHTVDWIIKFVRDPKSVKPDAKMPSQNEGRIKDPDLRAVAEYLASLK